MNQQQRKYLIEKIQKSINDKIKELSLKKQEYPSLSNYMFKTVMEGKLQLQPEEVIKQAIIKKALNSKENTNWLTENYGIGHTLRGIMLPIESVVVIPEEYEIERNKIKEYNSVIEKEIGS